MQDNKYPRLESDRFYHIYNRGNNSQRVFHSRFEVNCFLNRWDHYISPVAELFSYNFLPNHFHLTIRTRDSIIDRQSGEQLALTMEALNQAFSNFFISFSLCLHKANGSNGAVFKRRFQRKEIHTNEQFRRVNAYVLFNSKRHRLTGSAREYPFSSFQYIGKTAPAFLAQDELYRLFGGLDQLELYLHQYQQHYFPER